MASARNNRFYSALSAAGLCGGLTFCASAEASAAAIGANKFDLALQYLDPEPPAGADPRGYARVTRAMAEKAIDDAHDAGLAFLRAAVTGFSPVEFGGKRNDLALWQRDPAKFWAAIDAMFDALDRAGLRLVPSFVWNLTQFPALGREDVATFVHEPNSLSRRLLAQFVGEFIGRYRTRRTILFYELTNEMNLAADVDLHKRNCGAEPCVWGNFTTAEMVAFSRDLVRLIKSLDPSRQVTSGYSLPRPAAVHLAARPEFSPGGPDWRPDTKEEMVRDLVDIHAPFDILSVHVYPSAENNRFGRPPGEQYRLAADAAEAARSAGKPLFIGEFGDAAATPFLAPLLDEVVRENVDYAAIWVWEFYQTSTYQTRNTEATRYSVDPGYSDDVIALLVETGQRLGQPPSSAGPDALPRIVLTWPLSCAMLDRPTELYAVASDGVKPVKQIEFLADGKPLGAVASPPYHLGFDPAALGAQTADIAARAVAGSGRVAEFHSTVRLNGAAACQPAP